MPVNVSLDPLQTQEAQRIAGASVLDVIRQHNTFTDESLAALGTYAICSALHCEALGKPIDESKVGFELIFEEGLKLTGATPEETKALFQMLDNEDNFREIFSSLTYTSAGVRKLQKGTILDRKKLIADVLALDQAV